MGTTTLGPVQKAVCDPFGPEGAPGYDEDCAVAPSRYLLARDLQLGAVLRRLPALNPVMVDLGCGTGNDALELFAARRDLVVVGIDRSPHMLSVAEAKIRAGGYAARCHLVQADFLELDAAELCRVVADLGLASPHCVLASMTLHHYGAREKAGLYEAIAALGSAFVYADLFANECPQEAEEALSEELLDLKRLPKRRTDRPTTLSEAHYRFANRPESLCEEIDRLGNSGFATVDVLYRHGQLAVLTCSPTAGDRQPTDPDKGGN